MSDLRINVQEDYINVFFKLRYDTRMKTVIEHYKLRQGYKSNILLQVRKTGQICLPDDTPSTLGLIDEDILYVIKDEV